MRLLIADDHALFRDSLRSLLTARGVEVVGEAANGREAVALAKQLNPDVVLMDLAMPEVDGLAATRLISAELPAVKVVVLTAADDDAMLFEAIKSGAQGYILKNLQVGAVLHPARGGGAGGAGADPGTGAQGASGVRPPQLGVAAERRPRRPDRS